MCIILISVLIACNLAGCSGISQKKPADAKKEISGTIRISTATPDRFLEEAAQKFENLHPGVKVEVKAYIIPEVKEIDANTTVSGEPEKSTENYVNNINTELMSGKGADIISVRRLPYKKYMSRNMFADLKQLMKSDQSYDASKYYENLFDAVSFNNGLYTLPINYSYELLGGDTGISANDRQWNWQDFLSAASSVLNSKTAAKSFKYILPYSDERLFSLIFETNCNRFVNDEKKTASFTSQEFLDLLKLCKGLADKNQLMKSSEKFSEEVFKQSLFFDVDIFSVSFLASTQTAMNPMKYLYRFPSETKGSLSFSTSGMLAINNASPNKNTAWEFLKFLISDEMQSSPALSGLPVNKSAYKQRVATETNQFCQDKSINLSQDKRTELMQKYAGFNESMVMDMKICPYKDPQIIKIVEDEVHPFFAGKASAENVAQVIQKKVDIYIKE